MCGIAGILRVHPPGAAPPRPEVAIPEAWLDILDESIKHRGPDGHGRFRDRATRADGSVVDVALVHRRLSIIDHKDGHQPMVSPHGPAASKRIPTVREGPETGSRPGAQHPPSNNLVAVVFNGCIYNHRDLRRELTTAGHRFVTDHSDTEVLIHGWREWGDRLFERLTGMFALVIWDRACGAIAMARDQFGEKPLYYESHQQGQAAWINIFGSTCTGLTRVRAARDFPNPNARQIDGLDWWLRFGFGPTPPVTKADSGFPGHACVLESRGWTYRRFGINSPDPYSQAFHRREPLPLELAERLLERAVQSRLEADVPMGCFLSGGVDSSVVAGIAKKALGRLSTFTVRMPDPAYDESRFAERAAADLGTDHHTLDCDANPAADLVMLIGQLGVPFGDSSLLPTHWVSRAAAQHVKVCLSGDGGDELFIGYERYRAASELVRKMWLRWIPRLPLPSRDPKAWTTKAARLLNAARGAGYLDLVSIFPTGDIQRLLGRREQEPPPGWARIGAERAILWDIFNYLPMDLLCKSDTASMAQALEVRAPMLDKLLAQACLTAPFDDLIPQGELKGLLKRIAARYVTPEIVNRPKQGFAIPIGDWFRSDYGGMKALLLDHLNSTEPWGSPSLGIDLNMKFVRQMLDEHMNQKRDHSQRLYMLLVLSIWAKGQ